MERNASEETFFRTSNFKVLPKDCVGIDSLRRRLSVLLFEHVKKELPKLREDLEEALQSARDQLGQLGNPRSSAADCKAYLARLSLDFYEISKAAVNGHYEASYFHNDVDVKFSLDSPSTLARARAVIQLLNTEFAEDLRRSGHKYQINLSPDVSDANKSSSPFIALDNKTRTEPRVLTKSEALDWVRKVLIRTRGKELVGNFNPLLIGELFWEQSSKWDKIAASHVEKVARVCQRFLKALLQDRCPKDVETRIWTSKIEDKLKARNQAAIAELGQLIEDLKSYPINYNHYYTDTITKRREQRQKAALTKCIKDATTTETTGSSYNNLTTTTEVDIEKVVGSYSQGCDPNMDNFSCEEALDCLLAIYKVGVISKSNQFPPVWSVS